LATKRTKRVTLKDVAERAGVSVKTASNVKNDWPYVSEETRAKVKRAMKELGYRPSKVAQSLKTGCSETIGVVVPDISNPFFSTAFRGCEDELTLNGYSAFLCNTDEDLGKEKYYLDMLSGQEVDGLLLWGSCAEADILADYVRDDIPVVSVDGLAQQGLDHFTFVHVDNEGGAERIMRHLIESGRKRIAHLSGASHRLPAQDRMAGYTRALKAAGLPIDESLTADGAPSIGGGYSAAMQLLTHEDPDAVFCYNDLMAIGAIAAAEELNLDVPQDLAIVGFDDIVSAVLVTPMLTTIRIPQYELGQYAVELLIKRIQTPNLDEQRVTYPVELVIRNSCGTCELTAEMRRDLLRSLVSSAVNLPGPTRKAP
jgi:LacI family transcriptional regulator